MALIDTYQAVKKIQSTGLKENQAQAITEIISNIDQHVATKGDIARLEDKIEIVESKIEMVDTKLELNMKWLMGVGIATLLLLVKIAFFA